MQEAAGQDRDTDGNETDGRTGTGTDVNAKDKRTCSYPVTEGVVCTRLITV